MWRPPPTTFLMAPTSSSGALSLGHITGGAGFQNTDRKLIFRMHAQDQHRQFGTRFFNFLQDLQPAPAPAS